MEIDDAERTFTDLPEDHPHAQAARAILADRDSWRRQAERMERVFAEAVRGRAGRATTGSGT